ncbi:TRAP transporter small permease [Acidobacteriota bacterium]
MAGLILLILLTIIDIASRNLFNKPIPGAVEVSQYILLVVILMGVAYTQQVKAHVNVEFVFKLFNKRTQIFCRILTSLLYLFVVAIIVWQSFILGIQENTTSDMLRIPQYPFRLLVAFGGFFLWLEVLIDLIDLFASLRKKT